MLPIGCQPGEVVDPFSDREVDLEVIVEQPGDMVCWDLAPLDGELIGVWELICNKKTIPSEVFCDDFGLWLIGSQEKLNQRLQQSFLDGECNVNFEKEMVLGVCARRKCSQNLQLCDAKKVSDINVFRYLQPYTCEDPDAQQTLANFFLVIPQTGRSIRAEIHRYLLTEQDLDDDPS